MIAVDAAFTRRDGEISIPSMPLWRGLESVPGVTDSYPFVLGADQWGLIRQTTSLQVRRAITQAYAADNYTHITAPPGASAWADRLGDRQLDFIDAWAGMEDGLAVLEIGSGSNYVAAAIRRAWPQTRYTAIDPSLKPAIGVERIADYFPSRQLAGRTFDRVLSFNCLEHVDDPAEFLIALRRLLPPGGRAILSFPDTERQLRVGDLNALTHEHLTYFTQETAAGLMARSALRPLEWKIDEESLWMSVEAGEGIVETPASKPGLLALAAKRFPARFAERAHAVAALRGRGAIVAFHGATNGLNTFIHLAGLGDDDGLRIYDCDEAKAGRFLPAFAQAVRHCQDTGYRDVDRVFVAAMTYESEIRAFLVDHHGLAADIIEPLFPYE